MKTLYQAFLDYIKSKSSYFVNKKILDLGCGTGHVTSIFGKKNKVIGIDVQNVVDEKVKNFTFQIADATNLSFKDNVFDLVISFDVIEHVENDNKMLHETYRVLKKNGRILFGTPNKKRLLNAILKLIGRERKYPLLINDDDKLGKIIHVREYTDNEIVSLFEGSGFKKIKVTPFWFGTPFLFYGISHLNFLTKKYCQYYFIEAVK